MELTDSLLVSSPTVADFPSKGLVMIPAADNSETSKISPEFVRRLKRLKPQDKVRAVLLLNTVGNGKPLSRRQTYAERQAAIAALKESAQAAMGEISHILQHFGGCSLTKTPDVLGSLPIESNAAGINALAESRWVKAILEDQELRSADKPPTQTRHLHKLS